MWAIIWTVRLVTEPSTRLVSGRHSGDRREHNRRGHIVVVQLHSQPGFESERLAGEAADWLGKRHEVLTVFESRISSS